MNDLWSPEITSNTREIRINLDVKTLLCEIGMLSKAQANDLPNEQGFTAIGPCINCADTDNCILFVNTMTKKFRTSKCKKRDSILTLVRIVRNDPSLNDTIAFIKETMQKAGF